MIVHRAILKSGKTEVGYDFRKLEQVGRWTAHKDGAEKPYFVNLIAKTCTCTAGQNGRLCKHRKKAAELETMMTAAKNAEKTPAPPANGAQSAPLAKPEPEDRTLALARIFTKGDLGSLSEEDRAKYYLAVCQACDLNPASRPFEFTQVRGKNGTKTILYATKSAAEQLRKRDCVSLTILSQKEENGLYIVTVEAALPTGRKDTDVGATPVGTGATALQGEDRANAVMKAITKAKRRATLSICGLGMLDETEVESLPVVVPPVQQHAPQPVVVQAVATAPTQPTGTKPDQKPAPFDRIGALKQIDSMVERLKIEPAKFQKGLEQAYSKPTLQALLDDELADLHKRLTAKLPQPTNAA